MGTNAGGLNDAHKTMGEVIRQNFLYLNVGNGHIYKTIKDGDAKKKVDISAYEGMLIGIKEVEDTFEGQKVQKIELKIQDNASPQIAIVKFTMEAWYSVGFFSRIQKIDVSKPFTIGALPSDQNEKVSFCYLKQSGVKNAAGVEKVEADKDFPRPKKVTLGSKDVLDWTLPLEKMRAIMVELLAKLPKEVAATDPVAAAETASTVVAGNPADEEDSLPF